MPQLKISKREAGMLLVLLFAIGLYAFVNFLLVPQYNTIEALQKEIHTKKNISEELKSKEDLLKKIQADMDSIKSEISLAEKQIPYTKRIPEMLVTLDTKVSDYNMKFLSVAFDEKADRNLDEQDMNAQIINEIKEKTKAALQKNDTKEKSTPVNEDYEMIPIGLSFEGKYDDVLGFLKYIENADRKYIIDNFRLQPNNRKSPMIVSLGFRTFVLKDPSRTYDEPVSYPFMKGNLGKEYPFLNNPIPPPAADETLQSDINAEPVMDFTDHSNINENNTETGN